MFTVILHDAPYTAERSWNALRFTEKVLDSGIPVNVFLFSDAVYVARNGHRQPEGVPNLEDLMGRLAGKGAAGVGEFTAVLERSQGPSA